VISEAFTGALVGGAMRLAPEVVRFLDRRNERAHEIELQKIELKFAQEVGVRGGAPNMPIFTDGAIEAMREGYIQQQTNTAAQRFPWVAVLAAVVRPAVTWALLGLYIVVRLAQLSSGAAAYGDVDIELLSSVLAFWFLGRVYERRGAQ
jgi:hypothetical protein